MNLGGTLRKSGAKANGRTKGRAMANGRTMTGGIIMTGRRTVAATGISGGITSMDGGRTGQIMTGQIMPAGRMMTAMRRTLLMMREMPSVTPLANAASS